ncbi:MAG: bifunctional (p)ppGpp synthetase/guanosine-3',5'-bis(diphosphate) 3'-pyrophosphohydrolase [Candidatus Nomurabacteria bacterium]|nr:bifunctional (p)ppGpp synthetase/guanosine-3',5'-bis(diphosphate) 3'-pyrophosphohydrolase [Candidatus Nomurabacteria bacterium]USN87703.1 MAG: bifunctional (p)ppGpp synthetase/guanosine-3',5'-bis(diphosphate) 3'-pyrophosphohydrolase [Candidatus Nomurabacteria bacterium]
MTAKDIVARMQNPSEEDIKLVEDAFAYAEKVHAEQKRYSGEPYMNHLAEVGMILANMDMGARTIAAGLLHDTVEDTNTTPEDISNLFGDEILFLVDGVTKLGSVRYYGANRHNESLRKLFVATSQDIRVLIIKLADRLHNMQTLKYVPAEKQTRIARETLEIYVPVAHRLGMGKIRKELEDLAFAYVYPDEYTKVQELLVSKTGKSNELLEKERKVLQKKLADAKLLDFSTSYRVKGLYSLYHKLKRKDWDINGVYDLLAMRVIVPTVEDCYRALGIIHELWRPLPGRMKDYIAFPKPNGYQSIHTTVTSQNGLIMEIQIRTRKMHHEAEFGVASHITYKEPTLTGEKASTSSIFMSLIPSLFRPFSKSQDAIDHYQIRSTPHRDKIPLWISQIGQTYDKEKSTTADFIEDIKRDFFSNRIFVFTPNGDVVDLPVGATPIDFAYAIHSEIGERTFAAKVNKKLIPLDSELKNGDIVEIETRKSAKPTEKWLISARTSLARRRIRTALDEEEKLRH